jgi:DNA-binding NtrC family response regulator
MSLAVENRWKSPEAVRAGETVLLVDDESSLRELAGCMLEQAGYRVLKAESAVQARQLWSAHDREIALLITDLTLPDADGVDLARGLQRGTPHLKVLYVSGYCPHLDSGNRALVEGVNFLQKPFGYQALVKATRNSLSQHTPEYAVG